MTMSPSSLLARLDELKKWQEKQQERLLQQHKQRSERTNNSEYETIEGLSAFDSTIQTPDKQEYISRDIEESEIVQVYDKPKRPFLKRGTGLTRFNMKPGDQKRPFNKNIPRKTIPDKDCEDKEFNVTPLKKPEVSIKAVWQNISNDPSIDGKEFIHNSNNIDLYEKDLFLQINEYAALNFKKTSIETVPNIDIQLPEEMTVEPTACKSFECEPSEQTIYEKALERELMIFEALEEKAMHSSFCSTNSSVVRLLSSTPSKNKELFVSSPRKCTTINEIEPISEQDVNEKSVHFVNEVEENPKISPNSSVDSNHFTENPIQDTDFKDDTPWSDGPCSTNSSLNVSLTSTISVESSATSCARKSNENVCTEDSKNSNCDEALTKKLEELDMEIRNFRKENAKLQKLKNDFDKEKAAFKKEKKAFEKYVLEEKIKVEFYLEDEKKKLTKDKMVFERYVKDFQNRNNRKEREEISSLKQQLADLRESSKLKETRNATSQARLRNQIKTYEKETLNLKEELENLRKQNAKLQSTQKCNKRITDTKMLHEINKNLSKLTKDVTEQKKGTVLKVQHDSIENTVGKSHLEEDFPVNQSQENVLCKEYARLIQGDVEIINDVKENDQNSKNTLHHYENLENDVKKNVEEIDKTKTEILSDGSKVLTYPNGNIKTISPDGNFILLKYFNGDVKETKLLEGTVRYFYAESGTWHTTFADGTDLLEFSNGQSEKRLRNGDLEVSFPNGVIKVTRADATESISYPDGTKVDIDAKGEKLLYLPNGQKEVHNDQHKRREYPDGTVKILYPDGVQETRYSNGRIRIKDCEGNLLLDSHAENT